MWWKWFPWRQIVSRVARSRGLLDPVTILSRLERFGQPLEVKEPLELLRSGLVFHARGLLNTGAIQHNLDWIWPFWVERQYDPADEAFIPRAFSITHVNLTHRNWTAVGLPDLDELPIVDPRGLLTPFWDGWSLDAWIVAEEGGWVVPSQMAVADQYLDFATGLAVITRCSDHGRELRSRIAVELEAGEPVCRLSLTARSATPAWLVVSLRPYNPEGVSFVHDLECDRQAGIWRVDKKGPTVRFSPTPERCHFADYSEGDVHARIFRPNDRRRIHCRVGMATGAALFALEPGRPRQVEVGVPLPARFASEPSDGSGSWPQVLEQAASARLPDRHVQRLYETAVRTLILHSPGDVYPGPYTYRRFWFRDAAFVLHALLCLGLTDRAKDVLDRFPERQTRLGFFHSQSGEWDANGEALWIMERYCALSGKAPDPAWRSAVERGARWLIRKRLPDTGDALHAGLLPPGFSAEHLGPNDYYYWDDFWGVAGLLAAASLAERWGDAAQAETLRREAQAWRQAVDRSLARVAERTGRPGMPASPYRRLDSGAVGSLAAGYPLQLLPERDPRLLDTAEFLLTYCLVRGGFYLDIIHSGINPYLTLHLAQVLLRAGDRRAGDLLQTVAGLASPTGQWPEAVHPRTGGGCMGDGQHVWAAAEWVLMLRNSFLREEDGRLILASGVLPQWLEPAPAFTFGPAPSEFGEVAVTVLPGPEAVEVRWSGAWWDGEPPIEIRLPGFAFRTPEPGSNSAVFRRTTES